MTHDGHSNSLPRSGGEADPIITYNQCRPIVMDCEFYLDAFSLGMFDPVVDCFLGYTVEMRGYRVIEPGHVAS